VINMLGVFLTLGKKKVAKDHGIRCCDQQTTRRGGKEIVRGVRGAKKKERFIKKITRGTNRKNAKVGVAGCLDRRGYWDNQSDN